MTKSKQTKPTGTKTKEEPRSFFFMASCLVIYIREEQQRQRYINLLMQTASLNLTKADLAEMNKLAISRVSVENDVAPSDVKDVVFQNVACLGHMTEEEFHGPAQDPATKKG